MERRGFLKGLLGSVVGVAAVAVGKEIKAAPVVEELPPPLPEPDPAKFSNTFVSNPTEMICASGWIYPRTYGYEVDTYDRGIMNVNPKVSMRAEELQELSQLLYRAV